MKIEGNQDTFDRTAVRVEPTRSERAATAGGADRARTDRVELSANLDIVNHAMRVATETPGIRHDVVERARQKLAAGEIGQNLERLADRLIDHALMAPAPTVNH